MASSTQTIIFHKNDGSGQGEYQQTVTVGVPERLITNQFEFEKHDFIGWATSPFGEARYENNAMYSAPVGVVAQSVDLYAVWKKQAQYIVDDNDICITGYDPFPVVFRDMSRIRSFKNTYWRYDFGDSIIYGCDTSNITTADCENGGSAVPYKLPGDSYIYQTASQAFKDNISQPVVEPGLMMCPERFSYHSLSGGDNHYTGVEFKAALSGTSGSGCYPVLPTEYLLDETAHRVWYWPNSKKDGKIEYVEVSGIHELMNEDDCGRNACERENDLKNSVMHIYKGAGIYYATMQVSSKTGLQSMEVSEETFSSDKAASAKEIVDGCYIKVLPTCPCISGFHVYGDPTTSGNHYDKKFEVISYPYSCDDGMFNASGVGFNCMLEFTDTNGNVRKTKAISGYAPYLKVWASGSISPRSLPIKGAYIDWGDWFSDYCSGDYKEYGDPESGWPNWTTSAGDTLSISGSHIYVMPGLYSIGIAPDFNTAWIKKYMPTVTDYEECMDTIMADTASGCCVLVVENPPKFNNNSPIVTGNISNVGEHPTTITDMSVNVSAGSYPISRIDWDFGDNTKILSISTEGYKTGAKDGKSTKDVIGNDGNDAILVDYTTDCTTAVTASVANVTYGTMYGHKNHDEVSLTYDRWDARNYSVSHTYTRTNFDDHPNGYIIKVSAYAENTNTCVTASAAVLTDHGAQLPVYDVAEGDIELVDARTDEQEAANIVLQSEKDSRLYVNRVIDS